ncbi:MAG: glycogen debranching protein [Methanothrix sp.]|nr:MAG: glycogen debranching protein [Methanothrix sp.]
MTNESTQPRIFSPQSYAEGASREWLVANGIGGYASATTVGSNTRSYHGLLVAALQPPVDRWLLLSSLDEEMGGVSLANHQYPGVIHPQGFRQLLQFRLDPFPRFVYGVGDCRIEKTVFMIHGENTTIVRYSIHNGQGSMRIVPLVHSRSFHSASGLPKIGQEPRLRGTVLHSSRKGGDLALLSDAADFVPQETIYRNFEYEEEHRRGLTWTENLLAPGFFELDISGDISFSVAASIDRDSMPNVPDELKKANGRLSALHSPHPRLAAAADSFVVKRGEGSSIIAGYHWFDDWGRDTMISIPGLLLATGRFAEAKAVLNSFACVMKGGVLPNDLGASSYNTVDASLWFVSAVCSYCDSSQDLEALKGFWPSLLQVVARYSRQEKDFGMDEDGLIVSGPALTWMDARVDGQPVTARAGKCCEINALWYSALRKMEHLAEVLDEPWDPSLAGRVERSYPRFWNRDAKCLFDVIDPDDPSIRPNQIIAAAVPDLLPLSMRRSIFETVTRDLLTPCGLRTLSPRDPRYVGRYEGGPRERDAAYHQGTVWPWLMGPYVDALLSVNDLSDECRVQARGVLQPILELNAGGLETIAEVFDGDLPQRPGGCISQAWSVAELLRAWAKAGEMHP